MPPDSPILTADRMRTVEAAAFAGGLAQADLMARAGLAVARAALRLGSERFVVLAGPGNNGGDACAAAAELSAWGHPVDLIALGAPAAGGAAAMRARWRGPVSGFADAAPPEAPFTLIDGLFGTGAQRPLTLGARQQALFERARSSLAIDLPSGVDADSGAAVWSSPPRSVTLALGALKPAHVLNPAACGTVWLDRIGLGGMIDDLIQSWRTLARPVIRVPGADAHKYRRLVTIVAGAMPGAARLAARGAAGAGAGYVRIVGEAGGSGPLDAVVRLPDSALDAVLAEGEPLVVGPGLGRDDRARMLLDRAIASRCELVLDGDALSLMGRGAAAMLARRSAPTVLTPHGGEFDRMFGEDGGDKLARTLAAARACSAVVVHKGAVTVIATPGGGARIGTRGTGWLASAGTGDVLAGAIAARGDAAQGVWLHGRTAELAGPAFSADTLAAMLPQALDECRLAGPLATAEARSCGSRRAATG